MGFFDNLEKSVAADKAKKLDKVRQEIEPLLLQGEQLESCYPLSLDFVAITNKRMLFVDKKWSSSKRAMISVPWNKVTGVAMERGGFMAFSQEVEVAVGSKSYEFKFYSPEESMEAYNAILLKVL